MGLSRWLVVAMALLAGRPWLGFAETKDDRFAAVVRFWEWQAYWSEDGWQSFPKSAYVAGRSFRALTFSFADFESGLYWGFCSKALGFCQVYLAWADHSVHLGKTMRMRRGETELAAVGRFEARSFEPDEVESERAERGGNDFKEHLVMEERTLRLPRLGVPEAIRERRRNVFLEGLAREWGTGPCSVVVPFADVHSESVPVLTSCPKGSGAQSSILIWRKIDAEWVATAGGWMPQAEYVARFGPLIRKHASLRLGPRGMKDARR